MPTQQGNGDVHKMRFSIAALTPILASALLALPVTALADVQAGVTAWARGDYAAAVLEWETSAAQGDAAALYNLGQALRFGNGVPQDLAKAEEAFGKAAALGHPQAADNYGVLRFQRGDRSGALPYLIASTARGDARAQYLLGIANFEGDGVPQDSVRAYALLTLAQQGGLPQADTVITQMVERIPLYDRQKGEELASQLGAEIELKQARQLAVADPDIHEPVAPAANLAVAQPVPASPALTVPDDKPAAASWRVQLGAFGVRANADTLWNTLKDRPEIAGRTRIDIGSGRVKRLLAGGFATEAEATSACSQLAAAGFGCFIVGN